MLATPSICKYYIIFKRSLASTEVSAGALAKADQNVGHLESEGMAHGSCLNLFLEAAQYQMDPPLVPSLPACYSNYQHRAYETNLYVKSFVISGSI